MELSSNRIASVIKQLPRWQQSCWQINKHQIVLTLQHVKITQTLCLCTCSQITNRLVNH